MKKCKKIISAMLALCMLAVLTPTICFAAEGYYTTNTANKNYVTEIDGTASYNADETEKAAIKSMRMRAWCSWSPKADATYNCKYTNGKPDPNFSRELLKGEDYRGVLYQLKPYNKNDLNEGSREHWLSTSAQVQSAVDEMISSGARCVKGTDCSSSVCYAWRTALMNSNERIEVSEKEYYDYVVNDNSYDDDTDEITLEEADIIRSPFFE